MNNFGYKILGLLDKSYYSNKELAFSILKEWSYETNHKPNAADVKVIKRLMIELKKRINGEAGTPRNTLLP